MLIVLLHTNWTALIQIQYSGTNFINEGAILPSADSNETDYFNIFIAMARLIL